MPKKKVLLVNTNTETKPYPVPPLGLCLLAATIEKDYEILIHDGTFRGSSGMVETVRDFNPDYIALSIRNIDDMDILNPTSYIDAIRHDFVAPLNYETDAPIILGGSAFSIFPKHYMRHYEADYGIRGEGELLLPALLRCLDGGGDPASIPGIFVGNQPAVPFTDGYYDLDELPFSEIDRRLDYEPYRARGAYPIQTKRGCAHRCVYCTYACIEGPRYRLRAPDRIADEIEEASRRLGDITFEFVDSTFNDPPGHAEALCRELSRRKLGLRLRTMGINPGIATPALFSEMIAAGFTQIDCTPDAASAVMLKNLRKNFTLDELKRTARIIRDFDIPTIWFFVFGGPGETDETIRETLDFIDDHISGRDMVHMTCGLRIYPGTALHGIAIEGGIVESDDSLTDTRFYVSPGIGKARLLELVGEAAGQRPNCVPVTETSPPPEMMREAIRSREIDGADEPMFRSLLRLRYRMFGREMPS